MPSRTVVMLVVGFAGGLTLAACGPAASCTAANCGGCCSAAGKCESGSTADACGDNGASCGRCGTGTVCQAGECRASNTSGGGSGGGAGGGSGGGVSTGGGTGGGSSNNCRTIAVLETGQVNLGLAEYRSFTSSPSHYNYAGWVYPTASDPDGFRIEVVYPNDVVPNFPYTETFTSSTRYGNCTACGVYYESCNPQTLDCARTFLAQGGSLTITRADRASAGRLVGSGANVRFNQWNIETDMADGTGCVIATTVGPFNIGWNADGGAIPPP